MRGQRSNQLSYVPRLSFNNLDIMSRRMSIFRQVRDLAAFYLCAGPGSILGIDSSQTRQSDNEIKFIR